MNSENHDEEIISMLFGDTPVNEGDTVDYDNNDDIDSSSSNEYYEEEEETDSASASEQNSDGDALLEDFGQRAQKLNKQKKLSSEVAAKGLNENKFNANNTRPGLVSSVSSRALSLLFRREQQQHRESTKSDEKENLQETTFVLDDTNSRLESYSQNDFYENRETSAEQLGNTESSRRKSLSFDDAMKNTRENDGRFFERIGKRISHFFEQHPEIIEFIDGPEGEGNQGFYRPISSEIPGEPMTKPPGNGLDTQYWKLEARKYKSRFLSLEREVDEYKRRIKELESRLEEFKEEQSDEDDDNYKAESRMDNVNGDSDYLSSSKKNDTPLLTSKLSNDQITRYSRQLLLGEGFGVQGQLRLQTAKVLVIGAGGIGSTVLPYLAAAGVGTLTVMDHDIVDVGNLHRQILHSQKYLGKYKAWSACKALKNLNPTVECIPLIRLFDGDDQCMDLVKNHDVVVDATDNPRTRYLINDTCVLSGDGRTPLVSGSAMGSEGQLSVYNYYTKSEDLLSGAGATYTKGGGCYRCLYPQINAAEGCKSCSDNGVLGPVPGLIGILQAMEVLKILTGIGRVMHDKLLMYDALGCSFLTLKKPSHKKDKCPISGLNPTIRSIDDALRVSACARGPTTSPNEASSLNTTNKKNKNNVTCLEYNSIRDKSTPHVLLDVRVRQQYEICSLRDSVNIPLGELETRMEEVKALSKNWENQIYCICRRGIASKEATRVIQEYIVREKGEKTSHVDENLLDIEKVTSTSSQDQPLVANGVQVDNLLNLSSVVEDEKARTPKEEEEDKNVVSDENLLGLPADKKQASDDEIPVDNLLNLSTEQKATNHSTSTTTRENNKQRTKEENSTYVYNISGGLNSWVEEVDNSISMY